MRNSEFFKSTNTNSQTLCNSEELLAEKAVSANSNSSSEKTERLELGIGILFQCEDLQFWNFEFLRNFIICFTFSTENEKYLVIWLPGLLSGLFYRPTGQGSSSAEAFLCFSDLLGYHILSPSNLKTGSKQSKDWRAEMGPDSEPVYMEGVLKSTASNGLSKKGLRVH